MQPSRRHEGCRNRNALRENHQESKGSKQMLPNGPSASSTERNTRSLDFAVALGVLQFSLRHQVRRVPQRVAAMLGVERKAGSAKTLRVKELAQRTGQRHVRQIAVAQAGRFGRIPGNARHVLHRATAEATKPATSPSNSSSA